MKRAISPINEEEKQEGLDLEMEDAQTEEERELIRADRASAKQKETPFSRQFNEEEDNMTLQDLACQPCQDVEQEDQQEEEGEAAQPKAIWKPIRRTVKDIGAFSVSKVKLKTTRTEEESSKKKSKIYQ